MREREELAKRYDEKGMKADKQAVRWSHLQGVRCKVSVQVGAEVPILLIASEEHTTSSFSRYDIPSLEKIEIEIENQEYEQRDASTEHNRIQQSTKRHAALVVA